MSRVVDKPSAGKAVAAALRSKLYRVEAIKRQNGTLAVLAESIPNPAKLSSEGLAEHDADALPAKRRSATRTDVQSGFSSFPAAARIPNGINKDSSSTPAHQTFSGWINSTYRGVKVANLADL